MDKIDWKEIYKLPFHEDENCEIYVKDSDNRVVFNKCEKNPELYNKIIKKLNSGEGESIDVEKQGNYIYYEGRRILLIRGWGRLTGIGMCGYKLDSRSAGSIQDEFGEWVVKVLKKKTS